MENNVRKGFFAELKEKRVTTVAAAWVFYFLTTLLPVAFLLIAAFAVFGVDFADKVVGYLPEEFRTAGETILGVAKNASGGAIFFSTHVLEVAEKLCDRVGIIKKGRLVAEGTMKEVVGDKSLESIFLEIEGENTAEEKATSFVSTGGEE